MASRTGCSSESTSSIGSTSRRRGGSTKWEGSGFELIYNLTDPTKDFIGSALYGELLMNDTELELEAKLLLQKNLGPFALVYNAILEAEWEDGYAKDVGVLG